MKVILTATLALLALGAVLQWAPFFGSDGAPELPSGEPLEVEFRDEDPRWGAGVDALETEPAEPDFGRPTAMARMRFIDGSGAPVAGVRVRSSQRRNLQILRVKERVELVTAVSGSDGTLNVVLRDTSSSTGEWQPRLQYSLSGYAGGELTAKAYATGSIRWGDVQLRPGGSIAGRVVDDKGDPLGGAWVNVLKPMYGVFHPEHYAAMRLTSKGNSDPAPMALTDSEGCFVLRGVATGLVRLRAGAAGSLAIVSPPIEVRQAQQSFGFVLQLDAPNPQDTLEGIVLDPVGQPVPYAQLEHQFGSTWARGSRSVRAGKNGRFRMILWSLEESMLQAVREGFQTARLSAIQPGTQGLVLQLGELNYADLILSGSNGPLDEEVTIVAYSPDRMDVLVPADKSRWNGQNWVLQLPVEEFLLSIDVDGYEPHEAGPFQPDALDSPLQVQLVPLPLAAEAGSTDGDAARDER